MKTNDTAVNKTRCAQRMGVKETKTGRGTSNQDGKIKLDQNPNHVINHCCNHRDHIFAVAAP